MRFERLFVLWSAPNDGTRHVIGELSRDGDRGFVFSYAPDLSAARAAGFDVLAEFRGTGPFRSRHLFSTFAQRIPSPKRPDFERILRSWGVEHRDDPMEILALSGGVQMTDRIELSEYRDDDDDLTRPLVCRVAGSAFQRGQEHVRVGDRLQLLHERDNAHDPSATVVLLREGVRVGYVPRQYSRLVANLLATDREIETIALRRLTLPAKADRWVIRLRATSR